MTDVVVESALDRTVTPLRLGLVGTSHQAVYFLQALHLSGVGSIAHYTSPDRHSDDVKSMMRDASHIESFDALLDTNPDGIILATPTNAHVAQAEAAIARGIPVFSQRPLSLDHSSTRRVIDAARSANVLLGVDMRYRPTPAMRELRSTVQAGELGDIYAIDAVFHHANGPANAWQTDTQLSGGGCMLDCGVTMIDLALWTLGFPQVADVSSRLYAKGERIDPADATGTAEDYADAILDLDTGASLHLSCGWNVSAGQNARIELTFYGTDGGGTFRNVNGSLQEFTSALFRGNHSHELASSFDELAGRTVVSWASAIARGSCYDPWVEGVADVAAAVDRVRHKL